MRFFGQQTIQRTPQPAISSQPLLVEKKEPVDLSVLTDEQRSVITELEKGNSVVVDACIGSGKTRCLQYVVDYFSGKRILYLTYNRLLKLDAQEKITNTNATVQNYHGFVYKYLARRDIKTTPDKQIKTFLEKCSDIPLIYDLCLVDEYQDLEEDTAALLLHIHDECPNAQWVFVGDMKQKIYDKTKIDVYKDCIEKIIPNYVPITFTQCFRISKGHADFLSEMWAKHIEGVNENCDVSISLNFGEVLKLLDETPNKDVLILGPRYGLTQEIVNMLERHDPVKYNKNTVWTSIRDRDENFQIRPDSLIVTTYDGCKGMERPVCIVIDWTNQHYRTRVEKPFTDQTIITNLFCVAASRGKDKILFYLNPGGPQGEHFLQQRDLTLEYTQQLPIYEPSNMFGFKHQEDILRCMSHLKLEPIKQEDTSEIVVEHSDANIDLSPAIGNYLSIAFFEKYNFQLVFNNLDENPIKRRVEKWLREHGEISAQVKALALAAYDTQLFRYLEQAKTNYISDVASDLIMQRMGTKLKKDTSKIEVPCHVVSRFTCHGYADYVDDSEIPTELKFVGNLSNENYLQLAMYIIGLRAPFGYLWNVRTNEYVKVSVKNKEKFLDDVYTCITLGRKLRRE